MSGNKVIKSVSFNLTVKDDQAMLKHIKRKNFSGYIKKLIMKEMNRDVEVEEVETVEVAAEPKIETPQEKLDRLKTKRSESKPAPPNLNLPKN